MNEEVKILAKNLVNYSCKLKAKEKVLIEGNHFCSDLIVEIVNEVLKIGAYPFLNLSEPEITRAMLKNTNEEHIKLLTKYMLPKMSDMDAYIGISATNNIHELHGVSSENINLYSKLYSKPIHSDIRVKKTKWVILKYPTPGISQAANMSTEEFTEYFYKVCNLDYSKMNKAMQILKKFMEKSDKVRILGPGTDLSFSIKGINAITCAGEMNVPDGEVYTAPVKKSVNGHIQYNVPSQYNGITFNNVYLEFEDGKIIKCRADNNNTELEAIFNIDEGARYVGEFSFGLNPYITSPMIDILFDEKMAGSIHFTPGASYDDAFNGNKSAVHWDLVLNQTETYGGGEIYIDDVLVRKNGKFVIKELECLNPENLI